MVAHDGGTQSRLALASHCSNSTATPPPFPQKSCTEANPLYLSGANPTTPEAGAPVLLHKVSRLVYGFPRMSLLGFSVNRGSRPLAPSAIIVSDPRWLSETFRLGRMRSASSVSARFTRAACFYLWLASRRVY